MFGMSMTEIAIILVLAVIILGPEKLPPLARTLGKWTRQLRRASAEIRGAIELDSIREDIQQQFKDIPSFDKPATAALSPSKPDRTTRDELPLSTDDPYQNIREEENDWKESEDDDKWEDEPAPWEDEAYQDEDPHYSAGVALNDHITSIPLPHAGHWTPAGAERILEDLEAQHVAPLTAIRAVAVYGGPPKPRAPLPIRNIDVNLTAATLAPRAHSPRLSRSSLPAPPLHLLGGIQKVSIQGGLAQEPPQKEDAP